MPTALTDADKVLRNDTGKDIVSELQNLVAAVKPDAEDIPYDNTTSGLTADDVQNAIDEVQGNAETLDDNKSEKSDLTNLILTGTKNNTGSTIPSGTFFYLNGTLVRAKVDILDLSDFSPATNYEEVTAGGLNELVTPKLITPTYATGVSYVSGEIYQIGKIVVIQLRLSLTSSFNAGADMVSGLPTPATSGSSYLRFWTINGTVSISAAGVIGGYDVAAGTTIINGTYICS